MIPSIFIIRSWRGFWDACCCQKWGKERMGNEFFLFVTLLVTYPQTYTSWSFRADHSFPEKSLYHRPTKWEKGKGQMDNLKIVVGHRGIAGVLTSCLETTNAAVSASSIHETWRYLAAYLLWWKKLQKTRRQQILLTSAMFGGSGLLLLLLLLFF